jgi:hypothetical protein
MDKTTAIVVGTMSVVLMLVLGALGIAVITSNDDPAPAPTVTAPAPEPAPSETSNPLLDILEETWNQTPSGQKESLCLYFNIDPDGAFDAFNEGSEGLVPQDTFNEFFSGKCSSTT